MLAPYSPWRDFFVGRQWRGRPYLISPLGDMAASGGIALVVLLLLFVLFPSGGAHFGQQKIYVAAVMGALAFMVNDPHFISSYQLLYNNYFAKLRRFRQPRELWARYIVAGIIVPFIMVCYFLYAFVTQRAELFAYAIAAMFFFVGWHYVKQSYGLLMVLSAMKKIYYGIWPRRILLANCYIVWITTMAETFAGSMQPLMLVEDKWGISYRTPHLFTMPLWVETVGAGLLLGAGVAALLAIIWEKKAPSRTGMMGYFSMYFFLLLASIHPFWILIYPFFHSLQYLMFVYAYKRGELGIKTAEMEKIEDKQKLNMGYCRFVLIAFFVGILCFEVAPPAVEGLINPHKAILFPLLAAVTIFINIHHYFIDNVIWRKEHTEVSQYLFYRR